MMKKAKRYEIDSFEKLCNIVSEENLERISTDLCLWLAYHVEMMKTLRKKHSKETKGKTNSEIGQSFFIWIDDGKHDFKNVLVKNKSTGEISKISFKKK